MIQAKIQLTKRDWQLLELLSTHVALSFGQIQRFIFPGLHHATVFNRLKKLQSANLISRKKIHRLRHVMFSSEIGVVFQITTYGLSVLQRRNPNGHWPTQLPNLHGRQIDHDLIVVEVAEKLKIENPGSQYQSGAYLRAKPAGEPRPDGVLTINTKKIAIEVELTLKSVARYRELVAAYRISNYARVIYVVGSMTIAKRMATEIKGYTISDLDGFEDRLFQIKLFSLPGQQSRTIQDEGKVA